MTKTEQAAKARYESDDSFSYFVDKVQHAINETGLHVDSVLEAAVFLGAHTTLEAAPDEQPRLVLSELESMNEEERNAACSDFLRKCRQAAPVESELAGKLRNISRWMLDCGYPTGQSSEIIDTAADKLDENAALKSDMERLREAAKEALQFAESVDQQQFESSGDMWDSGRVIMQLRAALTPRESEGA